MLAPDQAHKWHWRDVRKVRRHLELHLSNSSNAIPKDDNSTLDYRILVFWLHAEKDELKRRLNERVEIMLQVSLTGGQPDPVSVCSEWTPG